MKKNNIGSQLKKEDLKRITGGNIPDDGPCALSCGSDPINYVSCSSDTGDCTRSKDKKQIICDGTSYDCPA